LRFAFVPNIAGTGDRKLVFFEKKIVNLFRESRKGNRRKNLNMQEIRLYIRNNQIAATLGRAKEETARRRRRRI
jgi:hypothetical protein